MKVVLGNCAVVASRAECKLKWALMASWYSHLIYEIKKVKDFFAIFCVLLKHTTKKNLLEFLPSAPSGYRYKAVNSKHTEKKPGAKFSLGIIPWKSWTWPFFQRTDSERFSEKNNKKRKMEISVHDHLFHSSSNHIKDPMKFFTAAFWGKYLQEPNTPAEYWSSRPCLFLYAVRNVLIVSVADAGHTCQHFNTWPSLLAYCCSFH